MKKVIFFLLAFISFFSVSCFDGPEDCPATEPELAYVDSRSAVINWKNVGEQYHYSITLHLAIYDEEVPPIWEIKEFRDTVLSIDGLSPGTEYIVGIMTHSNNNGNRPTGTGIEFRTKDE